MRYSFIYLIVGILFFVGCSSDNLTTYTVGDDFVETDIEISKIDTFSINAGTFRLDEFVTSGTSRMLLGSIQDDYMGNYTSQTFFELQSSDLSISSDAVYDSIGFLLSYDDYYYGDTLTSQTYSIFRLTTEVEVEDDDADGFYNTSELSYDDDNIGTVTFLPRMEHDTVYIPMDESFGEEMFNRITDTDLEDDDDEITSSAEFLEEYKGFTILPDTSVDSNMLGFGFSTDDDTTDNSTMRLYYSVKEDEGEATSYHLDFYVSSISNQFNKINSNFWNIENVEPFFEDEETTIYTGDTDIEDDITTTYNEQDLFYVQGGTGISSRIEFPSLRNLTSLYETATSLSAELVIYPLKGSYDDDRPLPETLTAYIVDHKNRIISTLTDADGNTASALLNEDDSEFGDTYYSIDMNGFVSLIVDSTEYLEYSIMLVVPVSSNTVDKVVFEKNDDMKLTVTYLNY